VLVMPPMEIIPSTSPVAKSSQFAYRSLNHHLGHFLPFRESHSFSISEPAARATSEAVMSASSLAFPPAPMSMIKVGALAYV